MTKDSDNKPEIVEISETEETPIETPPDQAPASGASDMSLFDQLQGLLEISNLVGSVMELDDILHEIAQLTAKIFNTPICSVYLLGPRRANLTLRAMVGRGSKSAEYIGSARLPLGRGLPGIAAERNELIAVPDASQDPRHETLHGADDNLSHAYICAPLRIQHEVIGVMTARRDCAQAFTDEDCMLFETICKQVAIVIEKSNMYFEKLEADRLAAISIGLSEVAHYIKNLLTGMKGGIFFVDSGLKKGDLESARKGWGVLQRGNKKIASLVENMLNYSRNIELYIEPHSVNAILYEILEQIDDTATERNIALLPELDQDLPRVELDFEKMYDAFLNLISNAIDAIPGDRQNGQLLIRSRMAREGVVEITFEDNGVGMSKEVSDKIFNLFFTTKGQQGSGIGLAVTRKIIERHKGIIQVESEIDKGTTFTIQLPVTQPQTQPES